MGPATRTRHPTSAPERTNQVDADAAYAIAPWQSLKGSYQYQQVDRNCTGSWIDCADAPQARTNTLNVAWDATMVDSFRTSTAGSSGIAGDEIGVK